MSNAVKVFNHFNAPKKEGVYYRIICLTGENKGKAYFLLGNRIVLGRSESADIQVVDLKSSREHAEITKIGDNYILTDLGSQNGVIINDLKVKQHTLTNGDKIIIGKTVYKFSRVEVVGEGKKTEPTKGLESDLDSEDSVEEKTPENKRLVYFLAAVIVGSILLFVDEEPVEKPKEVKTLTTMNLGDDAFARAIKNKEQISKANKEKLQTYFHRGLREYREGNYFRAIAEFESARQWSPNDPLANAYLRKTREKLDEQIEDLFNKAARDIAAINYRSAVTAYCTIIRVLSRYKDDPRYINATEGVKDLEQKMGLDEGEYKCSGGGGVK